ncbi:hypothetical protein [uncultured Bacteroides sp.]|uniref:hypothetical protein n=1 Tax=uncultured Bacteroides sp. TaxID=162156 RepID=UPI002616B661|nr:hypothetical protein [uncultured Bacteroides sp.]
MKDNLKTLVMTVLALFCFATLQSCNDDDDVTITPPSEVVNAFNAQYPDAVNPKWEMILTSYEVEFYFTGTATDWNIQLTNVEAEAFYTNSGKWIRTEFDVKNCMNDLNVIPVAVQATIAAQVKDNMNLVDDLKIIDWADKNDYYLLEVDAEPEDIQVMINREGGNIY